MSEQLRNTLLQLGFAALVALPASYFFEESLGWIVICAVLFAQLTFHLRNFSRLERWSRAPTADSTLDGGGEWGPLFGRLYRHERDLLSQIADRDARIATFVAAGQALTDGVVLLDEQNQIMFCNSTAEIQLGLVIRSDRGQPIINLIRQPEFVEYLQDGEFARPLTLRSDRAEERVLSIYILPFAGSQRLMQVKDVTQSDRLDRMRRDFVANVSHELRTPLTVLSGFLETLREIELDAEERARFLGMMEEQSQRMLSIVQDLLTLSSIESAPPPENEIVDMANLIDKLRRDAEALSAGRHTIIVETDGRGDLRGSEPELVSAFSNLVSNAIRYTPPGGEVRISWQANERGAEFAVQDTGIGIDPSHLPRLTERFYRVDRGRSRDAGGTGLGLAIVKHSLNRHQAVLEIKSAPGQGSRFAARFPANRVVGT